MIEKEFPPPATPRPEEAHKKLMALEEALYAPEAPTAEAARGRSPQQGIALIAAERQRQVEKEGWTPEHDAQYWGGEMLSAAHCYLWVSRDLQRIKQMPAVWPWGMAWWKPSDDPIRNLVKAGALIAAEIDRLKRPASGGSEAERADLKGVVSAGSPSDLSICPRHSLSGIGWCRACAEELTTLRSTHATLQSALRKYGWHDQDCVRYQSITDEPCSCGWDDLALNGAPGTE